MRSHRRDATGLWTGRHRGVRIDRVSVSAGDSLSQARRIERAQAAQMERSARASPPGAGAVEVAGGWAFFFAPASPYNSALGLGLAGPVEPEDLDRVEGHCSRGGGSVRVEVSPFSDPSLAGELARRGYALERFYQVWARPPCPLPVGPAAEIRLIRPGEERLWVDLFAEAFMGRPPDSEEVRDALLAMPRAEGNACFLACQGGEPAGVAIASAEGGVAQLSGAGVPSRFRGHALQAAMVRARLAWAAQRGCDLAASASDPATASQRTLEKTGFRCAYPKAVMVRRVSSA